MNEVQEVCRKMELKDNFAVNFCSGYIIIYNYMNSYVKVRDIYVCMCVYIYIDIYDNALYMRDL